MAARPRTGLHPSDELAALFRSIADYTYDWESWVDPSGITRWINPAVKRMTGFDVPACLAMRNYPLHLVVQADRPRVRQALRSAALRQSGNDLEFRIRHADGTTRWGAISWQSLYGPDGSWRGYRTSVRDVDTRKRAEEEIRQAKTRAEEADRAKSDFLATMSHEIRSPIQCIAGYAQLLERTPLSPKQQSYTKTLSQQTEMLLKIVDDILNFSSLQAVTPKLESRRFLLEDAVRSVVEAVAPKAKEKHLRLHMVLAPSARLSVLGDSYRVQQILANLVNNAVKFTSKGEVKVSVRARRQGSRVHVTFTVADTGIGIDAKSSARIFEPFAQADASTTRRYGGSGLGLAISHKLAVLMGGSLTFRTRKVAGASFVAVIPFAQASARAPKSKRIAGNQPLVAVGTQTKVRILVVDDNAEARELAQEMLRHLGFEADTASSGPAALRMAKRVAFDLVLMDLRMPDMDGLQTTTIMRRTALGHPCIYAMTANVLAEDRKACSNAGMDGFLGKPVRLADFKRLLCREAPAKSYPRAQASVLDASVLTELAQTRVAGGISLLHQFGARVQTALLNDLKKLKAAALTHRADQLATLAHSLKGHARLVGANRLARQLARIESRAHDGLAVTPLDLDRLAKEVAAAHSALTVALTRSANSQVEERQRPVKIRDRKGRG